MHTHAAAAATALAALLTLPACGGDEPSQQAEATEETTTSITTVSATTDPTTEEATTEAAPLETEPEEQDATGGYTGLYANTYDVAHQVCDITGLKELARQLGSARNPDAAATAYSKLSKPGRHRQAAYDGCLTALLD